MGSETVMEDELMLLKVTLLGWPGGRHWLR